jgi:hypothetical protein
MRKVQVYIEGERIELFDDEQIQVTSSVQNVQDIAKVFTDFSQSFTVPASPHNNAIFQHFYESAIDGTIDHQVRREARIEVDLIPFRTGKIQIEKSNLKKGQVENYTITFYGDIRTLQDYFGDDKLNTLDMSPYTHLYTGAEVQTRITSSSDYDVRYPLISSERLWVYGGGGQQDISKNSHHIHYTELFPAVRISRIFNAIETKYGIDFKGLFLNDKRFTNCYLWLKNKDVFDFYDRQPLDITGVNNSSGVGSFVNVANDSIDIVFDPANPLGILSLSGVDTAIKIYVNAYAYLGTNLSTNITYLDVYENDNLISTIEAGFGNAAEFNIIVPYDNSTDKIYTFKGRTTEDVTVQYYCDLTLLINGSQTDSSGNFYDFKVVNIADNIFLKNIDLAGNMPDMKISDFVSGVLKQFNLTCVGVNPTTFKIEPLEDWYSQGRIIDVTKHIDVETIDIQRVPLYKKISFKHQKSETFLNREFGDSNFREYGDLDQVYDYDGTEYTIDLPFENLLHTKFTNTNLQVGYSLNKTFDPVVPAPVLLYMNEQKTVSFYLNDGTSTNHITAYMPFGQDVIYNSSNYSLNFGWDNSSYFLEPIQNNVFITYYYNYLANLYNKKQRLTYCKGLFPTPVLTSLKMNDRLVIRDKRYIINEVKTNVNTGDVDLVLLYDFRRLRALKIPTIGKGISVVKVPFALGNGVMKISLDMGTTGVTASRTDIFVDEDITFTLPTLTEHYTIIAENSDDFVTENNPMYLRSEEYNTVVYEIGVTYEYTDGSKETDTLILTQEA